MALALGALAVARRFEELAVTPAADGPALAADNPAVLASLGAIALGRTLERWLEAGAPPRASRAAPPPVRLSPGELLR